MGNLYARVNGASRKVAALYTRQNGQSRLVSTAWAHVGGVGRNIHTIQATVFNNGAWGAISADGVAQVAYSGISEAVGANPAITLQSTTNYSHVVGSAAAATLGTIDVTHYSTLQFHARFDSVQWNQPNSYCSVQLVGSRTAERSNWTGDSFTGYTFPSAVRAWWYYHKDYTYGTEGTFTLDLRGLSGRYYLGFCSKAEYINSGTNILKVNNIVLLP